jgi:hypothetical protein
MNNKTPHIVIVGQGKLAQAIEKQCRKEKIAYSFWNSEVPIKKSVVLYCGSQRLFKEVSSFCKNNNVPFILLSTDVKIPKNSSHITTSVNTSKEVLNFMEAACTFAAKTPYVKVSILESHQTSKKDISGTAWLLAKQLGKMSKIITSIRDVKTQMKLGIPKEHLAGHAYHKVTFEHEGVTTSFEVLVLGRETYARGAVEMARKYI